MAGYIFDSKEKFTPDYAPDDNLLIGGFLRETGFGDAANARIDATASRLIKAIREDSGTIGGLEDFLREYGLSTKEGLALMVLAEALLRVPDAQTQDKLIEDKIGAGDWREHAGGDTWFVSMATWGLGLSTRIVQPGETPDNIISGLVKRLGLPTVRRTARNAMRFLGHHFVLGQTIEEALKRARHNEEKGFRHSYDMLGEGARTRADAKRYGEAYAQAITAIGRAAGNRPLPDRPGISVKLSALHPRYEATNRARVMEELCPQLLILAQQAKSYALNFTVDAEEANRLELSLEVIEQVFADPSLRGWDGFGLAIQAYQKRAIEVVRWVTGLAKHHDARMMVRLVKGAYWDSEIKHAQVEGLTDFPVFTRKPATDLSYIACAKELMAARPHIYPQFATHNALTVAAIMEMAGKDITGFEFQRLHGMGEALYENIIGNEQKACRIYAPVGGHRDLLAYLVRRLLENGANSSFVAVVGDKDVAIEDLLIRPRTMLSNGQPVRHPKIPLPLEIYGPDRRNSCGIEFGSHDQLQALTRGMSASDKSPITAASLISGKKMGGDIREVFNPANGEKIGTCADAGQDDATLAFKDALAAFPSWDATPADTRGQILERVADLLEQRRDVLMDLLAREAGKTLDDGIAEIREAVDFCRYYATEARRLFAAPRLMPGPTGEENLHRLSGRGVFVCISPWNFPLAIFLGQISAALAAGNTVIAKPAEQTSLIAYATIALMHEAGVPVSALQLVLGAGSVIGPVLLDQPQLAGVAFTGSTQTAWRINRQLAAKHAPIIPLIAETGGVNAMIVDATALPEQVSDDVIMSAFRSAGQRCSALRLLFVQKDVAEPVLTMIEGAARELRLGDPALPETDIGPVIDADAQDRLMQHVAAMRINQKIRYAGEVPDKGTFVAPHIIELNDAAALDAEHFGPILHVVRWRASELDKVIDAINASGFGLTFGIHSRIETTIETVASRLKTGNIYVNRNTIGAVVGTQPFGGSGLSGTGPKAGGPNYLTRFALEQVISTNTAAAGGNASLIALEDIGGKG